MNLNGFIAMFARGCMAAIFILSGINKVLHWDQTLIYMANHGLQYTEVLLFMAASIEIFAGLALFLGIQYRYAAIILALFLIPVTYVFHGFWAVTEPTARMNEYHNFMKNLAIFGGLILLALPKFNPVVVNK